MKINQNVLGICRKTANVYKLNGQQNKYVYVTEKILLMVNAYISALQVSGYPARNFFDAVYFKFKQNKDILKKLLDTGNAEIVEATVKENYWGCGPNNDGQNNYGKILVKVRKQLKEEQH